MARIRGTLPLCFAVALVMLPAGSSVGQRRVREAWTPPVEPQLVSSSEGPTSRYQIALALRITGDAEVRTDARLFELEVSEPTPATGEARPTRRRARPRTHRCSLGGRPSRSGVEPTPMHAGDVWGVALDLRAICWGAALSALEAGGSVVVRYGAGRARRAFVARSASGATAREVEAASSFRLPAMPSDEPASASSAPARLSLAPVDAASGRNLTFRVAVFGGEARSRSVWLRPDLVRFVVRDPRGRSSECGMPRVDAAPIPDLFRRISARRPVRYALDARRYCPDAFEQAGVYEVTPILELVERGERWGLDAIVGTFRGPTVPVRIRSGEGSLSRVIAPSDLRALLR